MYFVSASIYHKAADLALREGLDPELLAAHRAEEAVTTNAKYIPIDLLFDIYEVAAEHLAPGFSVRQGQQLVSEDYGTLGLSWRTCWRAGEVLDRTERFMVLVTDHGRISQEKAGGFTTLRLFREAHRKGVETANEAAMVMITNVLHEVTGRAIKPVEVHFQHSGNAADGYVDFFGCPVHFDQSVCALRFRTADLDIPTSKADHHIHQYLVERMQEEKEGIHNRADTLLRKIHTLITEALPGGIPSLISVAEHLGMSSRTLKRRLAEKEHRFRDLVQQIQQDEAVKLLRNTSQSVGEIAFQTGFSEQSAFNRAFKRWTGQSPLDYRKNEK